MDVGGIHMGIICRLVFSRDVFNKILRATDCTSVKLALLFIFLSEERRQSNDNGWNFSSQNLLLVPM